MQKIHSYQSLIDKLNDSNTNIEELEIADNLSYFEIPKNDFDKAIFDITIGKYFSLIDAKFGTFRKYVIEQKQLYVISIKTNETIQSSKFIHNIKFNTKNYVFLDEPQMQALIVSYLENFYTFRSYFDNALKLLLWTLRQANKPITYENIILELSLNSKPLKWNLILPNFSINDSLEISITLNGLKITNNLITQNEKI